MVCINLEQQSTVHIAWESQITAASTKKHHKEELLAISSDAALKKKTDTHPYTYTFMTPEIVVKFSKEDC